VNAVAASTRDATSCGWLTFIELRSCSPAGKSALVCPPTRQSNDPGGGLKQIQLQYAAIGTAYGYCGHWLNVQEMCENTDNHGNISGVPEPVHTNV
jgi:hypothetical protein